MHFSLLSITIPFRRTITVRSSASIASMSNNRRSAIAKDLTHALLVSVGTPLHHPSHSSTRERNERCHHDRSVVRIPPRSRDPMTRCDAAHADRGTMLSRANDVDYDSIVHPVNGMGYGVRFSISTHSSPLRPRRRGFGMAADTRANTSSGHRTSGKTFASPGVGASVQSRTPSSRRAQERSSGDETYRTISWAPDPPEATVRTGGQHLHHY
jgi:hypothetical protein